MKNPLDGAILQRDKKTYAIVPRTPVGIVTPRQLRALAAVVERYEVPVVKITSGQRMTLVGMEEDAIPKIWADLEMEIGRATELCLHYVQACPGNQVCKFGLRDSLGFGMELEEEFLGMDLPAKVKIGVSGCPLCCGESRVRDLGLIGKKSGWTVVMGGNAGNRVREADVIAEDLTREEAKALVRRLMEFYRENGNKRERTAKFMDRVGLDTVKAGVGLE
ncbi:NAD(P)/FAD-dependent oxidoreductase [Salidesulfovibrio onnuriiensis]|uniref:NAD(P)/FAD-dependent oxidoreductase n=1 Tax=Salidesulfovibrio onnuriiensis TaxID=2583823 RepID=UPI0011CA909B|nr:NAD(P)/FAD-dependent oxidoreductase [Salidesulfovibrio onnuriiensis]